MYLALATGIIAALLFSLKAVVPGADGEWIETYKYSAYVPYLILIIIIVLLDFLALTTYRFRVFQMRTATLAAIITAALQVWLTVDYFATSGNVIFRFTAVFPLVAVILDILAIRGIASDILVAESVNHLRSSRKKSRK